MEEIGRCLIPLLFFVGKTKAEIGSRLEEGLNCIMTMYLEIAWWLVVVLLWSDFLEGEEVERGNCVWCTQMWMMTRISRRITRGKANSSSDGASPPNDENPKPKARINDGRYRNFNRIFTLLSVSVVFLFIVGLCMNNYVLNPVKDNIKPRVVTPFPAPKLMGLHMFHGEHKEDLYWGTYRPHVYFGVRARTPQSLLAGLMWLGVKDGRYAMRHVCENSDDLKSYGWTHHNGRDYGRQVLVDQQLSLTTSFLKSRKKESGYGGDWTVRIEAESKVSNEEKGNSVHLFFYVADEGETALSLGRGTMDNPDDHIMAFGSRNDVGSWQLHLESEHVI